jgi:hypothetical protein
MKFYLNHGIMELWNDGIVGFQRKLSILNFSVKMNFAIYPILQYPLRAGGQDPFFQYSSIPPFQLGLTPPVFWQVAIKKQSADVKAKPCLFFSVINIRMR